MSWQSRRCSILWLIVEPYKPFIKISLLERVQIFAIFVGPQHIQYLYKVSMFVCRQIELNTVLKWKKCLPQKKKHQLWTYISTENYQPTLQILSAIQSIFVSFSLFALVWQRATFLVQTTKFQSKSSKNRLYATCPTQQAQKQWLAS